MGRPYPNLAPEMDVSNGFHQMGDTYPWIAPVRLLYYAADHSYTTNVYYIDQSFPADSFYPIGLAFFDFTIDYFSLMSDRVKDLCRQQQLTLLFYYHEGDNPANIKSRLDQLCEQHRLNPDCYRFVSGNTYANNLPGFVYFPDHELFYWRNSVIWNGQTMPGCVLGSRARQRDFTLLSRIHKWPRATIVAHLHQLGLLDNSYWSYNNIDIGDRYEDNPIELYQFPELKNYITEFLNNAPYRCDNLSSQEHNSHWTLVPEHFEDSYFHLVLETLYDADGTGGAFLTEKTFKPIRHAQPFVILGTPHSLKTLQELGYRTFDHAIDPIYDSIVHNTRRLKKTVDVIKHLKNNLLVVFDQCRDDIEHNQKLFVASKYNRLNNLYLKLSNS